MPISVSPIPGLPDHVNDVRLRTAEFINREILPRESELFVSRRGTTVTDLSLIHISEPTRPY